MKIKLQIFKLLSALVLLVISNSSWAFNSGDIVGFDPGEQGCLIPEYPQICEDLPFLFGVMEGSYFALDTNGNGVFEIAERIAMSPGSDGGIIIGQLQSIPSGAGCFNGEASGIDEPWSFFGCMGAHQTSVYPVTDNGNGTLDFRGWGVTWNGISVPLGGEPLVGETGQATLSCSNPSCSPGDYYSIEYTATVPFGDPSNFGGVRYQLHLVHDVVVPIIRVSINVDGGSPQECASIGGHDVSALANIQLLNGAVLDTVNWTVDGTNVGSGENLTSFLSLGMHTIGVTAIATTGQQGTATATVKIVDTQAPVISAAFVDNRSGSEINTIDTKNTSFIGVSMSASDICDTAPSVEGIGGFKLVDGDSLKVQGNLDKVELTTSMLEMQVKSSDASGNNSTVSKSLSITP